MGYDSNLSRDVAGREGGPNKSNFNYYTLIYLLYLLNSHKFGVFLLILKVAIKVYMRNKGQNFVFKML
jgi:hypothetical protein